MSRGDPGCGGGLLHKTLPPAWDYASGSVNSQRRKDIILTCTSR